jgi:hypothetical protein
MRRLSVFLGVLGLAWVAALPACAQKQIKIFGQNYAVVAQSRAQTYKNGVQIHLDNGLSGVNNYASVYFAEGPDRATDRLWFAAPSTTTTTRTPKGISSTTWKARMTRGISPPPLPTPSRSLAAT